MVAAIGQRHIDLFQQKIWKGNHLEKQLNISALVPQDQYQSGQYKAIYQAKDLGTYRKTLGGMAIDSYDPDGFLKSLGLKKPMAPGRTTLDLVRAFRLTDYKPDPRYLPFPEKIAAPAQRFLTKLSHLSPRTLNVLATIADKTLIKSMEKSDHEDPHPYDQVKNIALDKPSQLKPEEHYYGLIAQNSNQFAWDRGIHIGSIAADHDKGEKFGSYDVARQLGFTEQQARNLAIEDFDVDLNDTHYIGPDGKPRTTVAGSGGDKGDYHWHFNRSQKGEEDSRITAARVHMERAIDFARQGHYLAAEREVGIGLHGLQDMFSHGQISPATHGFLAEFPDMIKFNPVGLYETLQATEGYLKLYIEALNLNSEPTATIQRARPLVSGNSSDLKQAKLTQELQKYPSELLEFLGKNGVQIYLAKAGTQLTELGFGQDLNQDGKITPHHWVDVNQDGQHQSYEVEGHLADGRLWNEQLAAYNHDTKLLVLSESLMKNSEAFDNALRHELAHALDLNLQDDPQIGQKWANYVEQLYHRARRSGELAFNESNRHEFFAHLSARPKNMIVSSQGLTGIGFIGGGKLSGAVSVPAISNVGQKGIWLLK